MERIPAGVVLPNRMDPLLRAELTTLFNKLIKQVNWTAYDAITVTTGQGIAHDVVLADASASAVTLVLIPAAQFFDREMRIKKIDTSANKVLLATSGAEKIDGTATVTIAAQYDVMRLISDGMNWYKM